MIFLKSQSSGDKTKLGFVNKNLGLKIKIVLKPLIVTFKFEYIFKSS